MPGPGHADIPQSRRRVCMKNLSLQKTLSELCQCSQFSTNQLSISGQHYQEKRKQKRERKQPSTIPDLPYLHWERTGAPPAGPYNALVTRDLDEIDSLKKPDFMSNPHKFFGEKIEEAAPTSMKLPALAECKYELAFFSDKTLQQTNLYSCCR